MPQNLPSEIPLGRFIFERLHQLGIDTIFGVPGDFNLALLDHVYEVEGLRWAGNANELNAAYAADGYSRIKGISCLVTTFGVGELSALNGIAGAYAEHVGLIHIVGVPSIAATQKQLLLHHTLGNGNFTVFREMSENISLTSTVLSDLATAPSELDRCFKAAVIHKRPVYIGIPTNFFEDGVASSLLDTPLDLAPKPNDEEAEDEVVDTILEMVGKSKNPVWLLDACCTRHDVKEEAKQLVDITQFPVFVTPMGKSSIEEDHPRFGGVYVGTLSNPDVKKAVESADLVLSIGALLSDFNTGSFSYSYQTKNVVEFHSDYCKIKQATFQGVQMKHVLARLIASIKPVVKSYTPAVVPTSPQAWKTISHDPSTKFTQQWLWLRISSFLKEGDIVLSETGTSAFGIISSHFPKNTVGISQVLWGSIGYTVGATLGAAMAAQEIDPSKRVILFIGDGSLQLTVQEISTMARWGLNTYLFVLNNNGYTIERLIHGMTAQYNDIQIWDHHKMLPLFSGNHDYENLKVGTVAEVEELFNDAEFNKPSKLRMIEIMLDEKDAPDNLVKQAEITAKTNAAQN
ncbi:unnamed protein product [Kuraishia capsulata CBS 1993]|uniref:Pyruvate decarboxylase n=1 Tax=Kuraishia capsulata CBS 1993 TaxID=1382522 RepID=W6MU68_9ASCO|nr:uncharacterized protein KUCA_T00001435001 [Kuraishia capsulata CBS 1993]CDK25465.1 unnamed protein product [Kuraishia capsulata CBS 1993]